MTVKVFAAVTRAQGDLSKTTFAPERVLFTRGILPKYPESDWFCNRIKVEKENVFLAWEQDTDSPIQEVKVENATLYTPVQTAQNSFSMILDRNAETASFLFNTEAKKVYLTDEHTRQRARHWSRRMASTCCLSMLPSLRPADCIPGGWKDLLCAGRVYHWPQAAL